MKIKVTCGIIVHGPVKAKKGDVIDVPEFVALALIKHKKAEAAPDKEKKA